MDEGNVDDDNERYYFVTIVTMVKYYVAIGNETTCMPNVSKINAYTKICAAFVLRICPTQKVAVLINYIKFVC